MSESQWNNWPVNDTVFYNYLDRVIFACTRNNGTVVYTTDPAGFTNEEIKWKLLPQALPW